MFTAAATVGMYHCCSRSRDRTHPSRLLQRFLCGGGELQHSAASVRYVCTGRGETGEIGCLGAPPRSLHLGSNIPGGCWTWSLGGTTRRDCTVPVYMYAC